MVMFVVIATYNDENFYKNLLKYNKAVVIVGKYVKLTNSQPGGGNLD